MENYKTKKIELLKQLMELEAKEPSVKVTKPEDVLPKLLKYRSKKQEHFIVVTLSGSHEIIKVRSVTKGLLNKTQIHPREVFRPAIKDNAESIIIAHNHPSGDPKASTADKEIAKTMVKAGNILGIKVLDHIIIAKKGYYSASTEGDM